MIAFVLASRPTLAQPPDTTPREHKSLARAYLISLAATGVPLMASGLANFADAGGVRGATCASIAIAALVFGPSAGQWYAGRMITTGLVLRMTSAGAVAALAIADPHLDHVATAFGLLGSLALWNTGILWDAITLPSAVRRFNRARELHLAPVVVAGQGPVSGIAVGGTF